MTRLLLRALVILPLFAAASQASDAFEPLRVGQAIPSFSVRTLAGGSLRVGAGAPLTLVNIWAIWCGPCKREFPELQKVYAAYRGRKLRLLAISVDRGDDAPVRAFVQRSGATFDIGRDEDGHVQQLFNSAGLPESLLIGSDGRLLWRKTGAIDPGAADLRAAIEKALR